MRTSKKLGYSGFSELKFSIQQEQNPKNIETVENRVLDKVPKNIIQTLDVIDYDLLNVVIQMMKDANSILFAGVGDSIPFCEILSKNIRCLGKKVEYHPQIHDIEYISSNLDKDDLIVVISVSGNIERLNNLVKKSKENGVKTVCLTHYGKNPLCDLCDQQLCFWSEKRVINNYNVTDRSGLMLLVRMLCDEYLKQTLDEE